MSHTDRLRCAALAAVLACAGLGEGASASGSAFPGAVGYGADADGWRGGRLIAVTNLADRGAGSLRACAEADGPRLCIFRVAGTIRLSAPIMVRSDVYIAGQTAPGGGVQLRLGQSTHGPLIVKNAHDVVVRFLKLRPGGGPQPHLIDALTVENAQRVYLGNLSMAFATDETFNVHVSSSTAQDITLADSILAFSLDHAGHPSGAHSKGALICSGEGKGNQCGRISLIRNLFAHHRDRNPDVKATAIGPVEVLNNVFYDPISQFGEFYTLLGDLRVVYHGNVALTGPSTTSRARTAVEAFVTDPARLLQIDAADNLAFGGKDCPRAVPMPILDAAAQKHLSPTAVPTSFAPVAASRTVAEVTKRAGDRLPQGQAPHQDALDRRVLRDVATCAGRVIDRPSEVGGWPRIATAAAPPDRDADLLPDAWEAAHPALDPDRPDDPWTKVAGTAAIELWLADLAGDR